MVINFTILITLHQLRNQLMTSERRVTSITSHRTELTAVTFLRHMLELPLIHLPNQTTHPEMLQMHKCTPVTKIQCIDTRCLKTNKLLKLVICYTV